MVMAQTLFKLIKRNMPTAQIDVMAPKWSEPLLARMPEVHDALVAPFGHGQLHLGKRYQLGKSLRNQRYDQAIVLPNSWKSALIPFCANIPKRTGWRGEMRYGLLNDTRVLDKAKYPLMIERFMALGLPVSSALPSDNIWPELVTNQTRIDQALTDLGLAKPTQPILGLCPGAEFGPAKRWPAAHFAKLADDYAKRGWQIWIFGSAKDTPVAEEIQAATSAKCIDLTGKTSLGQAIDLMSLTSVVVTNDSGLMHIAAALKRPLVAVYGSSSAKFTPPLAKQVKMLSIGLDCSPCFKRECPLGHLNCLRDLMPEQVINAVDEVVHA